MGWGLLWSSNSGVESDVASSAEVRLDTASLGGGGGGMFLGDMYGIAGGVCAVV